MRIDTGRPSRGEQLQLVPQPISNTKSHSTSAAARWSGRLGSAAVTLFLLWHCCAMIVTPAPTSDLWRLAQRLQRPYLDLFRLNNTWSFFAPEVPSGTILRYVVEDLSGTHHTFDPISELSGLSSAYIWHASWFDEIVSQPEVYAEGAGKFFCRKHASLRPASVTLLGFRQKRFLPKDQLAGRHPLDPAFLSETRLKQVTC